MCVRKIVTTLNDREHKCVRLVLIETKQQSHETFLSFSTPDHMSRDVLEVILMYLINHNLLHLFCLLSTMKAE